MAAKCYKCIGFHFSGLVFQNSPHVRTKLVGMMKHLFNRIDSICSSCWKTALKLRTTSKF